MSENEEVTKRRESKLNSFEVEIGNFNLTRRGNALYDGENGQNDECENLLLHQERNSKVGETHLEQGVTKLQIEEYLTRRKKRKEASDVVKFYYKILSLFVVFTLSFSITQIYIFPVISDYIRVQKLPITYSCPKYVTKSRNDKNSSFDLYTTDDEKYFVEHYRSVPYGGWQINMIKMKSFMRKWKRELIEFSNLHTGSSIYESGMGEGINLLITAEILKEMKIDGIFAYGNDYVEQSISLAKSVWSLPNSKNLGTYLGQFCTSDSTNLSYVPSNSFDLVYTGYIDPLSDPLNIGTSVICKSATLADEAQKVQEEWYQKWIEEMVRIAKPGKVIAAEMNGFPICQTHGNDWGGVSKDWWFKMANQWGVSSIRVVQFREARYLWKVQRYHVWMRKAI
mmetsp:Transcript_19631/g.25428  ORF Transcript_19631/g.25428 Transcript_19631/m.25428 type:complete len:396 (+) Transcript_19631:113-1300(+)